jgi:hypothetical protein
VESRDGRAIVITNKSMVRRRRAILGRQGPLSQEQLVEQLRQVIALGLAAFTASRLLARHRALKIARVWTMITDELLDESIPDVLVHPVQQGVDRASAFKEALVSVREDEGLMLGRGMEIASGTIDGGLRCLLPACDLDEFWRRVRKVTSVVTECDLPEAPLRDAAPRRIG